MCLKRKMFDDIYFKNLVRFIYAIRLQQKKIPLRKTKPNTECANCFANVEFECSAFGWAFL